MDLRIFTEPHLGATYEDQFRHARLSEDCGFGAWFRSDHFLSRDGAPGPTDAWVTLGALARETSRVRLGTLVTSVTFRHAGLTAVQVAQVDAMSAGRVELGLGAGWMEAEHAAHGVPFPEVGTRFDLLEDTLEVVTGMWATPPGELFDHEGPTVTVTRSPGLPKPLQQPRPPIILGGKGHRRTPALAARFADEFNLPFVTVEGGREQLARVDEACRVVGRDPGTLLRSAALTACVGRDGVEVSRRAGATRQDLDGLRGHGLVGTPDEVVEQIGRWRERSGVERLYLQMLDLSDLDHLELVASAVLPQLG
ncbi:LLM class F420-dependent oxidoreductase [Ornithinimicrobium sp. W1665]|uniref:LLM class F420-dependent oxidoreductase n=1 Tax=Ornithinimicrobium sp. W1665 TaxID=3416666 RepID=UPI003CF0B0DE